MRERVTCYQDSVVTSLALLVVVLGSHTGQCKSSVATQGNVTAAFSHQTQKVNQIFPWRRDLDKLPWRGREGSQSNSCHSFSRALAAGKARGQVFATLGASCRVLVLQPFSRSFTRSGTFVCQGERSGINFLLGRQIGRRATAR